MTQQEMVELLQLSFPSVLEKTLRVMLNDANDQFVEETRIIRSDQTIQTSADQTEYPFSDFAIDGDNPLYLQRVFFDGDELYRLPEHEDKAWTSREKTLIVGNYEVELGQVKLTALESGNDLKIRAVYEDSGFGSDLSSEPNYPAAFHEAILIRVQEKLHGISGNLEMVRYYRGEYQAYRRRAKAWVGSQGTKGQYQTTMENFRGL